MAFRRDDDYDSAHPEHHGKWTSSSSVTDFSRNEDRDRNRDRTNVTFGSGNTQSRNYDDSSRNLTRDRDQEHSSSWRSYGDNWTGRDTSSTSYSNRDYNPFSSTSTSSRGYQPSYTPSSFDQYSQSQYPNWYGRESENWYLNGRDWNSQSNSTDYLRRRDVPMSNYDSQWGDRGYWGQSWQQGDRSHHGLLHPGQSSQYGTGRDTGFWYENSRQNTSCRCVGKCNCSSGYDMNGNRSSCRCVGKCTGNCGVSSGMGYEGRNTSGQRSTSEHGNGCCRRPSVDIYENGTEYVIELDAPGFTRDSIDVKLFGKELVISAKPTMRDIKFLVSERKMESFCRRVHLPPDCDGTKINAILVNGILKITISRTRSTDLDVKTM